jgi:hypothetical protein
VAELEDEEEEDVVAAAADVLLELVALPQPAAPAAITRATIPAAMVDGFAVRAAMIRAPY